MMSKKIIPSVVFDDKNSKFIMTSDLLFLKTSVQKFPLGWKIANLITKSILKNDKQYKNSEIFPFGIKDVGGFLFQMNFIHFPFFRLMIC